MLLRYTDPEAWRAQVTEALRQCDWRIHTRSGRTGAAEVLDVYPNVLMRWTRMDPVLRKLPKPVPFRDPYTGVKWVRKASPRLAVGPSPRR